MTHGTDMTTASPHLTPEATLHVGTPLGTMMLAAGERGLKEARFLDEDGIGAMHDAATSPILATAAAAIDEYFAGDGEVGAMPPLDLRGTQMQREIWAALLEIPAGVTRTYGEIARAIGRPSAVRAVGAAIGANPVGVLVPCHRVLGANGALTGYAGGLPRKRWLLAHEGAALAL